MDACFMYSGSYDSSCALKKSSMKIVMISIHYNDDLQQCK